MRKRHFEKFRNLSSRAVEIKLVFLKVVLKSLWKTFAVERRCWIWKTSSSLSSSAFEYSIKISFRCKWLFIENFFLPSEKEKIIYKTFWNFLSFSCSRFYHSNIFSVLSKLNFLSFVFSLQRFWNDCRQRWWKNWNTSEACDCLLTSYRNLNKFLLFKNLTSCLVSKVG